jgi:hypothetical protein
MSWRWLEIHSYHAVVLFFAMGACVALFAWSSYNLANLAIANFRFLSEYGWLAVMEGGLWQLLEIGVYAVLSLAFYLGFKSCEHELVDRWSHWRAKR